MWFEGLGPGVRAADKTESSVPRNPPGPSPSLPSSSPASTGGGSCQPKAHLWTPKSCLHVPCQPLQPREGGPGERRQVALKY